MNWWPFFLHPLRSGQYPFISYSFLPPFIHPFSRLSHSTPTVQGSVINKKQFFAVENSLEKGCRTKWTCIATLGEACRKPAPEALESQCLPAAPCMCSFLIVHFLDHIRLWFSLSFSLLLSLCFCLSFFLFIPSLFLNCFSLPLCCRSLEGKVFFWFIHFFFSFCYQFLKQPLAWRSYW